MKKYSLTYFVWAFVFIVFPLILILTYSLNADQDGDLRNFVFSLESYQRFFEPLYLKILLVSIGVALISTVLCLIVGYPVAYFVSKMEVKKQSIAILLFVIPMWMNFLLRTYAWFTLLGKNGILNRLLGIFGIGPLEIMYNLPAVMIGMVYNFLPFAVLPIYSVLTKIDPSLIEAAKDLGADNKTVFGKVIFPLSMPGVTTAITMVFIPAISTFVIPNLLGGNKFYLIGNLIEQQFTFSGNWSFGSAVSVILIIIMLVVMGVVRKFSSEDEEERGQRMW